jgi:hypothetical protein
MTDHTIYGLSNEDYHNAEPYRQYLSSSQLKKYLISPKAFKHSLDNPEETKSDALRFGSLFHDCMGALAEGGSLEHIIDAIAVFEPPINAKTGQPYGATTKAYKEAYEAFTTSLNGTLVSTAEERDMANAMLQSLLCGSGSTSVQVCKLLRWGKPEVSHFVEYEGCKFKFRPDFETKRKIVDWKTVSTDDLSEESINRIILKYGYHISAAFYQFFEHERTGIWKQFILVLVSKVAPYDCVMVDMSNYGYRYLPDVDMVIPGPGAMEFKRLLDLHIKCSKENHWPGAETFIPDNNGVRMLEIQPPRYYSNKFIELD